MEIWIKEVELRRWLAWLKKRENPCRCPSPSHHLHPVPASPPLLNHHRHLRLALSRIVWHQISFKALKTQYPRGHHVDPPHPWAKTQKKGAPREKGVNNLQFFHEFPAQPSSVKFSFRTCKYRITDKPGIKNLSLRMYSSPHVCAKLNCFLRTWNCYEKYIKRI